MLFFLPSRTNFIMSDKENWEIYQTIFKDQAKPYFELNGPITIHPVGFKEVDSQYGTILTNLWFGSLGDRSAFASDSSGCFVVVGDLARGVFVSTEGANVQKVSNKLPYTQSELDKLSQMIRGVKKGDLPASKLEKVIEFLDKLKQ